jgi:hypothetical protein
LNGYRRARGLRIVSAAAYTGSAEPDPGEPDPGKPWAKLAPASTRRARTLVKAMRVMFGTPGSPMVEPVRFEIL